MQSIFPILQCQRNLILLYLGYKTLCETQKRHVNYIILLGSCKWCWDQGEWCLVDPFHN